MSRIGLPGCLAFLLSLPILGACQTAEAAKAAGTKKAGNWTIVTNDGEDGRRDVAAVTSDTASRVGLGVRCIDRTLSILVMPLNDDRLFGGPAHRAMALSFQADDGSTIETSGFAEADRAVHLSAPSAVLALVLAARRLEISATGPGDPPVTAAFELGDSRRRLADLVRQCPTGSVG